MAKDPGNLWWKGHMHRVVKWTAIAVYCLYFWTLWQFCSNFIVILPWFMQINFCSITDYVVEVWCFPYAACKIYMVYEEKNWKETSMLHIVLIYYAASFMKSCWSLEGLQPNYKETALKFEENFLFAWYFPIRQHWAALVFFIFV